MSQAVNSPQSIQSLSSEGEFHARRPPYFQSFSIQSKQMSTPNLRVFGIEASFSEELLESQWTETSNPHEVTVLSDVDAATVYRPRMITLRVKDVIDALAESKGRRPIWIQDFHDDPIAITEDMFEVLVAYRAMKQAA